MPPAASRSQTRPRWPRNGSSSSSIRSSVGAWLAGQRPRHGVRDVVVADADRVGVAVRGADHLGRRPRADARDRRSAGGWPRRCRRSPPAGPRPARRAAGPGCAAAPHRTDGTPSTASPPPRPGRAAASARPGPGAGSPKCRTILRYARCASLPVTFCSSTARSSRWKIRPVAGIRTPAKVLASRATSGCRAARAGKSRQVVAQSGDRVGALGEPGGPGAVGGRDELARRRGPGAESPGPSGVRAASQKPPAVEAGAGVVPAGDQRAHRAGEVVALRRGHRAGHRRRAHPATVPPPRADCPPSVAADTPMALTALPVRAIGGRRGHPSWSASPGAGAGSPARSVPRLLSSAVSFLGPPAAGAVLRGVDGGPVPMGGPARSASPAQG